MNEFNIIRHSFTKTKITVSTIDLCRIHLNLRYGFHYWIATYVN